MPIAACFIPFAGTDGGKARISGFGDALSFV